MYFKKRKTGGISINSVIPLTHMDDRMVQRILAVGLGLGPMGLGGGVGGEMRESGVRKGAGGTMGSRASTTR